MEQIEQYLNQHLRNRGGLAGTVRSIAERTRNLLPAVAAVVRSLDPTQPVDELAERMMLRLELGIPAEVVHLAQRITTPLTRPQWMRLHAAGIVTPTAVENQELKSLKELLGDEHSAENLLRELCEHAVDDNLPPLYLPRPTE
jgi:hypothetical protein